MVLTIQPDVERATRTAASENAKRRLTDFWNLNLKSFFTVNWYGLDLEHFNSKKNKKMKQPVSLECDVRAFSFPSVPSYALVRPGGTVKAGRRRERVWFMPISDY